MNKSLWLIHPPQADPTLVPVFLLELQAHLQAAPGQVQTVDLNLETFAAFCSPPAIQAAADGLSRRLAELEATPSLNPDAQMEYLRTAHSVLRGGYVAEHVTEAIAVLSGDRGQPDHEQYQSAARVLYRASELFSAQFFPTLFLPFDLHMRFSSESSRQAAAGARSSENPFAAFFRERLFPRLATPPAGHVHLLIEHDQQLIPALTLAFLLKENGARTTLTAGGAFVTRFAHQLARSPYLSEVIDGWIPGSAGDQALALKSTIRDSGSGTTEPVAPARTWNAASAWPITADNATSIAQVNWQAQMATRLGSAFLELEHPSPERLPALASALRKTGLPWGAVLRSQTKDLPWTCPRELGAAGCRYIHVTLHALPSDEVASRWVAFWDRCREADIAVLLTLLIGHPDQTGDPDGILRLAQRPEVSRVLRLAQFRIEPEGPYAATPTHWGLDLEPSDADLDLIRYRRRRSIPDQRDPVLETGARWQTALQQQDPRHLPAPLLAGYAPTVFGSPSGAVPTGRPIAVTPLSPEALPVNHTTILPLRYSLAAVEQATRRLLPWQIPESGAPMAPSPQRSHYAYDGDRDRILPLPSAAVTVAELCNGRRTAAEIAASFADGAPQVFKLISQMTSGGVLRA